VSTQDGSDLAGRVAVVTGAGNGIGRGIALRAAADGMRVAVLDRVDASASAVAEECRAAGAEAIAVGVDVSEEEQVVAAFVRVIAELGTPWLHVNAAGIGPAAPFLEMDGETWRRMLSVNLDGTFLCAREAARAMVAGGGGGRIVNFGSQIGLKGGERQAHYAASKAGVHGFTRATAREMARHGITVNAIAPGPIETDMLMGMPDDWLAAKKAELPLGRFGRVEEIVPTVMLLASPVGGGYITGAVMNLSGGDVMAD
jgi:3-oxoacyl-[acyl-carrier protein] reductase